MRVCGEITERAGWAGVERLGQARGAGRLGWSRVLYIRQAVGWSSGGRAVYIMASGCGVWAGGKAGEESSGAGGERAECGGAVRAVRVLFGSIDL